MADSKPTRAAFELKKLQTFPFHLMYSTLNLSNWFMYSKQILLERKLWDTLYIVDYFEAAGHNAPYYIVQNLAIVAGLA